MRSVITLLFLLASCVVSLPASGQLNFARVIYRDTAMSFEQAVDAQLAQLVATYPSDTGEGGRINAFSRWADFMSNRICADAPQGEDQLLPASKALANYIKHQWQYCQNSNGYTGNWKNLGPFINSYGGYEVSGRIDALWVDSANRGFILAGASTGGLWKTTDTGHHWTNISDNSSQSIIPGTMGVYDIAVNPLNHNYIYINTGTGGADDYSWGYATGIAFTTNGGIGWQYDSVINAVFLTSIVGGHAPAKIAYMPGTQRLIATWDTLLYEKSSPSASWQQITVPGISGKHIMDFEFGKSNPSVWVFLVQQDSVSIELKVYNSGSGSWTNLPLTLPAGEIPIGNAVELSLPEQNTAVTGINSLRLSDAARKSYMVYCDLSSGNFVRHEYLGATVFPEYFEVSPSNPAIIYGTVHDSYHAMVLSTDSGWHFYLNDGTNHADGRCLVVHRTTNTSNGINDIVLAGTDGGIVQKKAGQSGFSSIVGEGLCISQFYGFSNSEGDDEHIGGGAQDNGVYTYAKQRNPAWQHTIGGDGYKTKFARRDNLHMYGETNFPEMHDVDFSAGNYVNVSPPTDHNDLEFWNSAANKARPLYFDTANIVHVGMYSMWRQHIGDNGWTQVFSEEPKPNDSAEFYQVLKFILPEKAGYSNVAYVAYKGQGADDKSNDPTGNGNPLGRLYRTQKLDRNFDVGTKQTFLPGPGPNWKNITPGAVGWARITDMTIDPDNPARIWITLGEVSWNMLDSLPSQQQGRVFYSSDYGDNWTDVSKGLPPLPIDKIAYQRGTDDILYAGTDVGVFIWNKAQGQWCQFNKNLPPSIVTDMEINYCAGKLRISTFGRGIWECDILNETATYNPAMGDFVPNQADLITTSQTWANDRWIQTGVRIKSGATLTIQNTSGQPQTVIHMPKNGAIVVEPGGKLIVDGAKITNDCGGFWKGILVEGDPGLPQRPESNQGVAEVKDGAIIEHARVGLGNNGESVEPNPLAVSGGIIRADGAFFLNDARGIAFGPYHNKLGNVNLQNDSRISRCTFIVDDDYRGETLSYPFQAHIALSDVDGIYIAADTFKNLSTMPNTQYSGNAITTWNAGIMVVPECGTLTAPCPASDYLHNYFQGFNIAVNINSSATNYGSYNFIDYADFKDNGIGVYARYANDVQVFHSHFNLDQNGAAYAPSCNCTKGIYLVQTPQFRIEEDTFTGYASGSSGNTRIREGVRIESCGGNENNVYRNAFGDVEYGAIATGINRDRKSDTPAVGRGLQFCCNDFVYNNTGILVEDGIPSSSLDGIRRSQGTPASPADNTFNPAYNSQHQSQLLNHSYEIWYTRNSNSNTYVLNNLTGYSAHVWLQGPYPANKCSAHLIRNPVTGYAGYTSSRPSFAAHVNAWQSATAALATKMNGGSLAGLLGKIDQSTDGIALGDTLFSLAPYLSDEVLRAAAANNKVPIDKMMQVLLACPEMLSEDLLEYLGFLMPGAYPEPYIDTLRAHRADVSLMSDDLTVIDTNYQGMTRDYQDVVWEILSDTNGVDIDTLAYWRKQLPEVWPRYQNALAYLGAHRYSDMQAVMSVIPDEFSLADESLDEYNTYQDVMNLLTSVYQDGRDELGLDSTELDSLLLYAEQEHGAASYLAGNLRNQNLGIIPLPCDTNYGSGSGGQQRIKRNEAPFAGTALHHEGLRVHPNPARDEVTFDYDFAGKRGPLVLAISTAGGRLVYSMQLSGTNGSLRWNARNMAPGVYLYKVTAGTEMLQAGKISVVR